jgi:hypothetical protein
MRAFWNPTLSEVFKVAEQIVKDICVATGCSETQVIEVVNMVLEYLHRVSFCHEHNVTEAVMQCMWCFGGRSCFHFGGILEQARIGTGGRIPWSEVFLRFAPNLGEKYGPILDRWLNQRSDERKNLDAPR